MSQSPTPAGGERGLDLQPVERPQDDEEGDRLPIGVNQGSRRLVGLEKCSPTAVALPLGIVPPASQVEREPTGPADIEVECGHPPVIAEERVAAVEVTVADPQVSPRDCRAANCIRSRLARSRR